MNPSAETVAPADRDLILASVESQKMELDQFVSLFYAKFFERCPDTRPMFPHDMSLQEEKLLMSLTHIIEALEHPAKLRLILLDQGERHKALQINDDAVSFVLEVDPARGGAMEPLRQAAEALEMHKKLFNINRAMFIEHANRALAQRRRGNLRELAVLAINQNQYTFNRIGTGKSSRAAHVSFAPSSLQSPAKYAVTNRGMTAIRIVKNRGIHRMPFQKYTLPPSFPHFMRNHRRDMLKFVTSETRK